MMHQWFAYQTDKAKVLSFCIDCKINDNGFNQVASLLLFTTIIWHSPPWIQMQQIGNYEQTFVSSQWIVSILSSLMITSQFLM